MDRRVLTNPILWKPTETRAQASAMYRFMRGQGFDNYAELHRWSVTDRAAFWQAVVDFCEVSFSRPADKVLAEITAGDLRTKARVVSKPHR